MQKGSAFLLCYEEVKLLQINIQNFGGRGADSYNLSGSSIALSLIMYGLFGHFYGLFSYFVTLHFYKKAKHKTPKKLITSSFLRVL